MPLFITGTGTGVGKTLSATGIMHRYGESLSLSYWKPLQTGSPPDNDTSVVQSRSLLPGSQFYQPYLSLPHPLSPHRALELSEVSFSFPHFMETARSNLKQDPALIIEGAGGLMVPLDRKHTWVDFIQVLSLPVVVAASTKLGTINHSLLTLHALRSFGIKIAGVVFVGEYNDAAIDNMHTILSMGDVPDCGIIPVPDFIDDPFDLERFDPDGILATYLR